MCCKGESCGLGVYGGVLRVARCGIRVGVKKGRTGVCGKEL